MSNGSKFALTLALIVPGAPVAAASQPCAEEMTAKAEWVRNHLGATSRPIFSFLYGGVPVVEALSTWRRPPTETTALPDGRVRRTQRWSEPGSGLEIRLTSVEYIDYPAVEWTVYIANRGTAPTPIIEGLQGIDLRLETSASPTKLRTTRGDNYSAASYEPLDYPVAAEPRVFAPVQGRPTNGAWPYFNLDGGQSGVFVAIGWPGQWQARFAAEEGGVRVVAGQELTRLRLNPGEEIRTPLVALVFRRPSQASVIQLRSTSPASSG